MSGVVNLNSESFEQEVLSSEVPVLVDFWASWCGPCRMVGPIVEEIAGEREGKLKVCKLDVDAEGDIAQKYNIMSIPTLMIFKDGKVAETIIGAQPKLALDKFVDRYIS